MDLTTGIDPNDLYYGIPGYEGPREGYGYSFMMGYYKLDEAKQQYEDAYNEAVERGVGHWDFEGHAMAAEAGYDGNYGAWMDQNMDWVNAYCAKDGCTYEQYRSDNTKYDR